MKFEFSAGGVVYKHGTTQNENTTRNHSEIYILVSQHSFHHGWVFPKGLIGDREDNRHQTREETAVREVKEETGIDAEVVEQLKPVTYWYAFEREKRKKTVYYYIMKYLGGNFEERDDEMEAVEWLPIEEVAKRLTYPSDKKVWAEARPKIELLVHGS